MLQISRALTLFVGILHIFIAIVEMVFWSKPKIYTRLDRFKFTSQEAAKIAPIVANAGLYNAFIGVGLIWAVLCMGGEIRITSFFLVCVIIAGVFGGITLKPTTFLLQSLPAAVALAALLFSKG